MDSTEKEWTDAQSTLHLENPPGAQHRLKGGTNYHTTGTLPLTPIIPMLSSIRTWN